MVKIVPEQNMCPSSTLTANSDVVQDDDITNTYIVLQRGL